MLSKIWPEELETLLFVPEPVSVPLFISDPFPWQCPNCGGARVMMVYTIKSGPYRAPLGGKGKWLDMPDGRSGWYSGELHIAHCPVCVSQNQVDYYERISRLSGEDLKISLENFTVHPPYDGKKEAYDQVRSLLGMNHLPAGFVTLYGDYGRGKTHLLKGLVNGFRLIRVVAQYYLVSDLLGEIKENFCDDQGGIRAEWMVDAMRSIRVLCLDELTRFNPTPWAYETLDRILDYRQAHMSELLTVMACNIHPRQFPKELQYLHSRMEGGIILEVGGPDVREVSGQLRRRDLDLT